MSYRADPHFLSALKKYGAVNIESCFNCGNCTAVCPLSTETDNFPRRMIRYAQLGMQEKLLSSKELWLCYYCGECTSTCPRQADPGEFMASARRFAVAQYDPFGLARWLYTSTLFSVSFMMTLALALSLFIYSFHGPMPEDTLRLFEYIPYEIIHNLGIVSGIVVGIMAIAGIASMVAQIRKGAAFSNVAGTDWMGALWKTLGVEVLGQSRYRKDCETYAEDQPWFSQKWFIHATMLWGFLGLFLATALDYLLDLLGLKPTGTWVPIWYPIRLLGTLAGVLFVYGTSFAIIKRMQKADEGSKHSTLSDWAFLILLWLGGVTGFVLEVALYLPRPHAWSYAMLLVHLVVVGELLILLPFTKFSHAIFRTVALFVYTMKPLPQTEPAGAGASD